MGKSSMSVERRIAAFMTIASEELEAAKVLSQVAPRQAAYYVQQAAEKAARAALAKAAVAFGTSHSFEQMALSLPADHPLRARILALDKFSGEAFIAVVARYVVPAHSGPTPTRGAGP